MAAPVTRRTALKVMAAGAVASMPVLEQVPVDARGKVVDGMVVGKMTGAAALVESLKAAGTLCVFGIPGAQENELWDEMKSRGLPYLLVTHEQSAAFMADGYARSTGCPGVICIVPGPGVTNALTGIGEALLDSIPMVCIVGDVARGEKYKPFQVHELNNVALLQPVTKGVFPVCHACDIPSAVAQAFQLAVSGEPGPTAVVIPYNLLIEECKYACPVVVAREAPFDEAAFQCALRLLSSRALRVGIYAGLGCMDYSDLLVQTAELLQAPVATSVSGKGVINECHPLAVGWGYGGNGTKTAEEAFKAVDLVLAIGVRFSEVSTALYSLPQPRYMIQVDANPKNLGAIMKPQVCVPADAGVFLTRVLAEGDLVRRPVNPQQLACIKKWKQEDAATYAKCYPGCGVDPMAFILALRQATAPNALVFVDVCQAEHWAAEAFTVFGPRTYFNPTDNQAMGWSIPAALGAQRVHGDRQVVTMTGDGCFLMTAVELSTAARACLPVKFFILDDQAYHYMQTLQLRVYKRTTATMLARLDYAALAKGFGLAFMQIDNPAELVGNIHDALCHPGPVLVRVVTDYSKRPMRWMDATRKKYTQELSAEQKVRFLARMSGRALVHNPKND
jgi:acetolactate synthase-1/2/3 large subunit